MCTLFVNHQIYSRHSYPLQLGHVLLFFCVWWLVQRFVAKVPEVLAKHWTAFTVRGRGRGGWAEDSVLVLSLCI